MRHALFWVSKNSREDSIEIRCHNNNESHETIIFTGGPIVFFFFVATVEFKHTHKHFLFFTIVCPNIFPLHGKQTATVWMSSHHRLYCVYPKSLVFFLCQQRLLMRKFVSFGRALMTLQLRDRHAFVCCARTYGIINQTPWPKDYEIKKKKRFFFVRPCVKKKPCHFAP